MAASPALQLFRFRARQADQIGIDLEGVDMPVFSAATEVSRTG